jgi:hypothetical protein
MRWSAADTFGASSALPALLRQVGEVCMGERPKFAVSPGECAAVWTGGELPAGTDAMVMLEDAEALRGGLVAVESPDRAGQAFCFSRRRRASGTDGFTRGVNGFSARDCGSPRSAMRKSALPRVRAFACSPRGTSCGCFAAADGRANAGL